MKPNSFLVCLIAMGVAISLSPGAFLDRALDTVTTALPKSLTKIPLPISATNSTQATAILVPKQFSFQVGQIVGERVSSQLDQTDAVLFEKLARLYALFHTSADKIWSDGFRLDQDIVYLVREDDENALYGYVINHPRPEEIEGASRLTLSDDLALPPVYRVDNLDKARLARHPFDFEYSLAGESVMMMKYTSPNVDSFTSPTAEDWDLFLAHEAFHRYQDRNWKINDNDQDLSNYNFSTDALALILLEQHILHAGLNAADSAARTEALRQFAAVRNVRIETYGRQIVTLDSEQERFEGTAFYLEDNIRVLSGRPLLNLREYLVPSLASFAESDVREYFGFGRFYETGSALSRLLDLQGVAWRNDVANGKTQYDVIKDHYDISDRDALIELAKSTYNDAELLSQAERYAAIIENTPTNNCWGISHDL